MLAQFISSHLDANEGSIGNCINGCGQAGQIPQIIIDAEGFAEQKESAGRVAAILTGARY